MSAPGSQWIRKLGLIVGNSAKVLDLSNLEAEFSVKQGDFNAPSTAMIRVFNPQPSTVKSIQTEYDKVSLQAGYKDGNYGVIFSGDIMQVKTGKLENVTRYIDILAADGDLFHSYAVMNDVVAPNQPAKAQFDAVKKTAEGLGYSVDSSASQALAPSTGGVLPRGKVLFGFAKAHTNGLADTSGSTWWIENGVLKAAPLTGYSAGEAVVINSTTGQVGVPEATEQGLTVRTLLNPKIKVGCRLKLNNNEITSTQVKQIGGYPNFNSIALFANLDPQGLYTAMVVEHTGGIRKNAWYTDIVALAIDPSSGQVQSYG